MRQIRSVCTIDGLGRILIPISVRRELSIFKDDQFDLSIEKGAIMLKKIDTTCIFCGNTEEVTEFNGKFVCDKCIKELASK